MSLRRRPNPFANPAPVLAALALGLAATATMAAVPTRDELVKASWPQGRAAFQQRCSACHTLAQDGANLVGPNLWGILGRNAGTSPGFNASDALKAAAFRWNVEKLSAFLAGPEKLVPGTRMMIPEPVPEQDRTALIAFMMVETGAADWPRPAAADVPQQVDQTRPLSERHPSFFNHLMSNTTRYRMETAGGELRFDAYFNADGSVSASIPEIHGFWNTVVRKNMEFFCYALTGIPAKPSQLVECFPVAAMAIPRFSNELWKSNPVEGVTLHGGIVAGRP